MVLKIKNEQGSCLRSPTKDKVDLIQSFISFLLSDNHLDIKFQESTPLIRHIDLYADTYVNSTQAEIYIKEFAQLLRYTTDENLKEYCKIVISELENLERCTFLVFFGD